MLLSSGDIAEITSGHLHGPEDILIENLIVDSRKVTQISPETLFVALRGPSNNGHKFIPQLFGMGIRVFIVDKDFDRSLIDKFDEAAFIRVQETMSALHKLAAWKRSRFGGNVIAITGSNGKTIVKEWLADCLESDGRVLRSPRSYNSQTGVPLSVWPLDSSYGTGIFEAGMSAPGEIEKLEKIIRPWMGVITNIGQAHQENFPDLETKAAEKLRLFTNCEVLIYCADQEVLAESVRRSKDLSDKKLISWSIEGKSADYIFEVRKEHTDIRLVLKRPEKSLSVPLRFKDGASTRNLANIITILFELGWSSDKIVDRVADIRQVEMRMTQKEGINGCTIIEDYYNSDPSSLSVALDFLQNKSAGRKRIVISDFVGQGGVSGGLYDEVLSMINRVNPDSVILVGEELPQLKDRLKAKVNCFGSTGELLEWFNPEYFRNETILLKGARKFRFERLSSLLSLKAHLTTLEINLGNLRHNLMLFRSRLAPGTKVMAMVKAFAYGAGPEQLSSFLVENNVDYLAVAYIDEGVHLRRMGIKARIMVMNPDPGNFETLLLNDLEPEIFNIDQLDELSSVIRKSGNTSYPVHIKIDTGMHRLGFTENEISELVLKLRDESCVRVASVFSHLAGSEDRSLDKFTHKQAEVFIRCAAKIEEALAYPLTRHLLNSTGVLRFPEYHFDMVRLGIGLFKTGVNDHPNSLPVLKFRTHVSQVRTVGAGEGIGYGLKDVADDERTIAIIPVGYADGLRRALGQGRGEVFIKQRRVAITGDVCMDMCMVDVTGLDISAGEEVEIFGDNITVNELALKCATIPYEIITGIPPRVKRIYLYE